MGKEEKLREKADVLIAKAERLMDNGQSKKSAEKFQKSGEIYFELGEWKIAEQCFFFASKNLSQIENYHTASNLQRLAANCCVLIHDFAKARDYYDIAVKSILKSNAKNLHDLATVSVCFAFLCLFIQGKQDDALTYVKRFKSKIDSDIFNDHVLVRLVKNLSNAIINQKESYLNEILKEYSKFKFRAAEGELIRASILVALCAVNLKFNLNIADKEFKMDELVDVNANLDYKFIEKLENHNIIPHHFESIKIKEIGFILSENITNKVKPDCPITLNLKSSDPQDLKFQFRMNFPGESYVGPLMLTIEVDQKFYFFVKSDIAKFNIVSPKAVLSVELLPQKTPVINQSFPLQVKVSNNSDGEAMEIDVEFEFPEEMRMVRGTFKKTIYSLSPNEDLKWQILVKALDGGEIPIKTIVSFKDGDGNPKGPFEAQLPLNINL